MPSPEIWLLIGAVLGILYVAISTQYEASDRFQTIVARVQFRLRRIGNKLASWRSRIG